MAKGLKTGGRQKGTPNKKSQELIAMAAEAGATPIEVMLDNMRVAYESAKVAEGEIPVLTPELLSADASASFKIILQAVQRVVGFRKIAQECARDAAPFLHPKLSAVEHSGSIARTSEMSDDELANIAARGSEGTAQAEGDTSKLH